LDDKIQQIVYATLDIFKMPLNGIY